MEGESGSLAEPGSPRVELFALQQYSRKMTALEAPHLVIGRLRDYFARRTNWQRRLWNPGTVTVLQETLEAVQLLEGGKVALGAVEALARTAERRAGPDSGIGTTAKRKAITEILRKVSRSQMVRYQFEYLLRGVGDGYLQRWSGILRDQPDKIKTEEASRLVAGHLLGLGFSPDKLHRWSTWLYRQRQPQTLADLFEEAEALARSRKAEWVVFIPFRALGRHGQTMPDEWLDLGEASRWLLDHVGSVKIRHNGGFVFKVCALDPWAAVEEVSDIVESLGNRIAVGIPGNPRFESLTSAFVAGFEQSFSLERPRRQVEITSLKREEALFAIGNAGLDRLRSAIDLVAPLETGAPVAAVAGSWAALEAILARPDEPNFTLAHDLAHLVACSFTRAELTSLSYAYEQAHDDRLADALGRTEANRERCRLLYEAIKGDNPVFPDLSDSAAAYRMRELIDDPRIVLERVVKHVEESLSRLYRQRNLMLHAGKTDSIALPATLRTVPPLVGAGLDRLVHDALTDGQSDPLRLVARAKAELALCGRPGGSHVVDLLGH